MEKTPSKEIVWVEVGGFSVANAQHYPRRQQAASQSNKKRWRQEEINRNLELEAPVKGVEITEEEEYRESKDDETRSTRGHPKRHPEASQFAYWYHKPKYVVRRIPRENAFKPTYTIKR
jgi:hypothetical protein